VFWSIGDRKMFYEANSKMLKK